jgi:hypothetical protein
MAKKTTTPVSNQFTQIAQKVHGHGLRASPERVVEMIQEIGSNFFSFAVTEDHGAIILVIATDKYFHDR